MTESNTTPPGLDLGRPLSSFFATVYEVLVRPESFFSRFYSREMDRSTEAVVFAVVCNVIAAVFSALIILFTPLRPVAASILGGDRLTVGIGLVFTLVLVIVLSLLYLLVGTGVQHLITLPFIRDGEGLRATLIVVAYGYNAITLVSWIPFVGYLAILYGIYVAAMGLKAINGTTTGRALPPAIVFVALQLLLSWPQTQPGISF